MIPAEFEYTRPATVADAVSALAEAGEDAKVLAGGQSLIPVLRLRLAYPTTVVDVPLARSRRRAAISSPARWAASRSDRAMVNLTIDPNGGEPNRRRRSSSAA